MPIPAARAPVPRCFMLVAAAAAEGELEAPAEDAAVELAVLLAVDEAVSDEPDSVEDGDAE